MRLATIVRGNSRNFANFACLNTDAKVNSPKNIAVLGSTGSIGTQTLDIIGGHPEMYRATVLVAGRRVEELIEQARKFRPALAVIADESAYGRLRDALEPLGIRTAAGAEAVADAVLSGTDLECGNLYPRLVQAVEQGIITEKEINVSLARLLEIQFRLGMFDPVARNPYASIGRKVIECPEHKAHAYNMARKSMVLLKNEGNILPLDSTKVRRIALVGPNINNESTLLANYFGVPSEIITLYKSLKKRFGNRIQIDTITGVGFVAPLPAAPSPAEVARKAADADVIIFVGGISADYEGEAGDAGAAGYGGFASGDRTTIALPAPQTELLKELKKTGRPIILVNMSGSVGTHASHHIQIRSRPARFRGLLHGRTHLPLFQG